MWAARGRTHTQSPVTALWLRILLFSLKANLVLSGVFFRWRLVDQNNRAAVLFHYQSQITELGTQKHRKDWLARPRSYCWIQKKQCLPHIPCLLCLCPCNYNSVWGELVTEPGSFARHTASQKLRCWGLQQRKGLFTSQPSKEMEKQNSNWPPWRCGSHDIYEIKKQGDLRHGKRWLEVRKRWSNHVMNRYIWVTCSSWEPCTENSSINVTRGSSFGPSDVKGHPSDTHAGPVEWSVTSTGSNWSRLYSIFLLNNLRKLYYNDPCIRVVIYRWQLWESCYILPKLHKAWRVCNLQNQLRWAWLASLVRGYYLLSKL